MRSVEADRSQEATRDDRPARASLTIGDVRTSDLDFVLEAFRGWDLDCHGFRGERAWRVMAEAACSGVESVETLVLRHDHEPVGFLIVVTRPGEFWSFYLSRLGIGALVRRAVDAVVRVGRSVTPETGARPATPVDPEFLALARRSHRTNPGVAWGLFGYVAPRFRKPPAALMLYRRMFGRLREKGFERLEGQIRFGNDESVEFHRALGFDIRNVGFCLHAVKTLKPGGRGESPGGPRTDR